MEQCKACGHDNSAGAKFCNECAQPLGSPSAMTSSNRTLPDIGWFSRQWKRLTPVAGLIIVGLLVVIAVALTRLTGAGAGPVARPAMIDPNVADVDDGMKEKAAALFEAEVLAEIKKSPGLDRETVINNRLAAIREKFGELLDPGRKGFDQTLARIARSTIKGSEQKAAQMIKASPDTSAPGNIANDMESQLARIGSTGGRNDESILKNFDEADGLLNQEDLTYKQLKKATGRYAGRGWAFEGKIVQIQEQAGQTWARVACDSNYNNIIYAVGDFTTELVDGNRVVVIGYLCGDYTYTSQAGWKITIPAFAARAMVSIKEGQRLTALYNKKKRLSTARCHRSRNNKAGRPRATSSAGARRPGASSASRRPI